MRQRDFVVLKFFKGFLNADGSVDAERTRVVIQRVREIRADVEITFHRAFDMSRDLSESLETLIELRVDRVLTSGAAATAPLGIQVIAKLVLQR
jgi:copper homeostasis protein